jgi:hypothetical protein
VGFAMQHDIAEPLSEIEALYCDPGVKAIDLELVAGGAGSAEASSKRMPREEPSCGALSQVTTNYRRAMLGILREEVASD